MNKKLILLFLAFFALVLINPILALDWPMQDYNSQNLRFSPYKGEISVPKVVWNYSVTLKDLIFLTSGDMNKDGKNEVIFYSENMVQVLNNEGELIWTANLGGHINYGISLYDLIGNEKLELIVGAGNHIYILNDKGKIIKNLHFPNLIDSPILPFTYENKKYLAFTSNNLNIIDVQELMNESDIYENYIFYNNPNIEMRGLSLLNSKIYGGTLSLFSINPFNKKTWKYDQRLIYPPVVGQSKNKTLVLIYAPGKIQALNLKGNLEWEVKFDKKQKNSPYLKPVLADLNSNGVSETTAIDPNSGNLYIIGTGKNSGKILSKINTLGSFLGPSLADIDSDNMVEVVFAEHNSHKLYCLNKDGLEWTFSLPHEITGPPIFASITNPGKLNIIVPTSRGIYVLGKGENSQPQANLKVSRKKGLTGDIFEFSGFGYDKETPREYLSYRWNLEGNWGEWTNQSLINHTYNKEGNYEVILEVKDLQGDISRASEKIKVFEKNEKPIANFEIFPEKGNVNTVFYFSAHLSYDREDPKLSYRWNLNGTWTSWSERNSIEYKYNKEGTHTILLEVRDSKGETSKSSKEIKVEKVREDLKKNGKNGVKPEPLNWKPILFIIFLVLIVLIAVIFLLTKRSKKESKGRGTPHPQRI